MKGKKNDLISIIVPFYNVEAYAAKCIESIINQTYENIEIILVDDGSPDNCGKICDEYAKKDSRIKVIHKKNGGLSDARNVGFEASTGKYVGFIDSDDYIEPDMYEYLYKLLKDNDADISLCSLQEFYENEEIEKFNGTEEISYYTGEEAIKDLLMDKKIRSHAIDKLYKRELFDGIRYPLGRKMEDVATTYRLFEKCNKIVLSNIPKYYYLQRNNGIMLSKSFAMWKDYFELSYERHNNIKELYPNMLENDISMLILIMYLFAEDNKEFLKYLKDNNVKKIYNKLFSFKLIKNFDLSKNIIIRLCLLRLSVNVYRFVMKLYLKRK